MLEDNSLKEFINKDIIKPTDAQDLTEWRKCVAKAWENILGVRDNIFSK